MMPPSMRLTRTLAAMVLLAAVGGAQAGDAAGPTLRTRITAQPPAGSVRLHLHERGGRTVLVGRWRHHSRALCCRSYPARVAVRGADGAVLHSASVEYAPRRLRQKSHSTWLLTFEHALPDGLPPGAVVQVRQGADR